MNNATQDHQPSLRRIKTALALLLAIYVLSVLCLQAFGFIFTTIGRDLHAPAQAQLITAIPSLVLGIVCFIYGSLADYVSLRKMTVTGIVLLLAGSVLGFALHSNIWLVIAARTLQTAGGQVAGSVYLVIAAKYLPDRDKVVFFGIFTAGYQFSTALGVLSAGFISQIDWAYLFLLPLLALFLLPALLRDLPAGEGRHARVDVPGFLLFGGAIGAVTLFFSYYRWWLLLIAAGLLVVFGVYIHRAAHPFLTPRFLRNKRWIASILVIVIIYFVNFSFTPVFNVMGPRLYGITAAQVSLVLLPGYILAVISGVCSGRVVDHIGRERTLMIGASCVTAGLLFEALCVRAGLVPLAIGSGLFYGGLALLYSPLTSTVLGTLAPDEQGRGVGMNDLAMNVSPSTGTAIFGGLLASPALAGGSIIGATGPAAIYSNLFLIYALICAAGLVYYLAVRRMVAQEG